MTRRVVTTCHECEGPLLLLGDPPYMGGQPGANRYGKWIHVEEDGSVSERCTEIDRTDHDAQPVDDGHTVDTHERKPLTYVRGRTSTFGRVGEFVTCPFCGGETWTYVWSRAGSGKRCETPGCDAILGSSSARRPVRHA